MDLRINDFSISHKDLEYNLRLHTAVYRYTEKKTGRKIFLTETCLPFHISYTVIYPTKWRFRAILQTSEDEFRIIGKNQPDIHLLDNKFIIPKRLSERQICKIVRDLIEGPGE